MNTSIVGVLYIVATPIGNLKDITLRALDILKNATFIVAEDTRHEHNEREQTEGILQRLLKGSSLALISDAGTPLICDPGYRLIAACQKEKIPFTAAPLYIFIRHSCLCRESGAAKSSAAYSFLCANRQKGGADGS